MTFNSRTKHADFKEGVVDHIRTDLNFTRAMTKDMVLRFEKSDLSRHSKGVQLLYLFQQDMLPPDFKRIMNVQNPYLLFHLKSTC